MSVELDQPQLRHERALTELHTAIAEIDDELRTERERQQALLVEVVPAHGPGAANLLDYLTLRKRDLRDLQSRLASAGLSSLGRCEGDVAGNIQAVRSLLEVALGWDALGNVDACFDGSRIADLRARQEQRCTDLLGTVRPVAATRIMVTMPSHAATEPRLIEELLDAGMGIMRINCAHDDRDAWQAMIGHLRRSCAERGEACAGCKVYMDLGGPKIRTGAVGDRAIVLKEGDRLLVERDLPEGVPALVGEDGQVLKAARIACTLPRIFDVARVNDPVYIDDGKIAAVITGVQRDRLVLRITRAREKGERLKADKGLLFPATALPISALTSKDREDLGFAVDQADLIGLSFVRHASDVRDLLQALPADRQDLGVVLKIETRQGFDNLPDILLAGMRHPRLGVMIARGDLALEVGFERLAEVQEELLWLCEAAHLPVIWATQVLESLAKRGLPSRGDITDAAMSVRADCVMLNKGPHIVEAMHALSDILGRMAGHQYKKAALLRPLRSWTC